MTAVARCIRIDPSAVSRKHYPIRKDADAHQVLRREKTCRTTFRQESRWESCTTSIFVLQGYKIYAPVTIMVVASCEYCEGPWKEALLYFGECQRESFAESIIFSVSLTDFSILYLTNSLDKWSGFS
jgi:hypothetical protein